MLGAVSYGFAPAHAKREVDFDTNWIGYTESTGVRTSR